MRAVSVAFSPARPSRLKKLPGILPTAYMRSSTSTVSGRKSTSRSLPAVAVESTIVSPAVTTTEPLACLASLPVSKAISVPPISRETRLTPSLILGPFSCLRLAAWLFIPFENAIDASSGVGIATGRDQGSRRLRMSSSPGTPG